MGRGGPPMGRGGPPMGRGGPPPMRGGPHPMGRGEPMDRHWEEPESMDYAEEGDPYWDERRPPMRGMRPPFPPGRGRPPRGHPGFMHQGRGRPPHGPMDHEPFGHEIDTEESEIDPARHPMYHGHDHNHPMHPDAGRGRRVPPPPPHEIRDPMEEPLYDKGLEGDLGWQHPHGRGRPLPPHEIMERGGVQRRPRGRGMARGMWRPGPHQAYEEGYNEGCFEDYGHEEDGRRWRPPQDCPPEDYRDDSKYFDSEWNRERPPSERDYTPRRPPSEPYRGDHWPEERDGGHTHPYDEHSRGRGELRIREYRDEPPYRPEEPPRLPLPSEWDRPSRIPPPTERAFPADYEDRGPRFNDNREEPPLDRPLPPAAPLTKLSENISVDSAPQGTSGPNVLALSQYQHEIILKAAQELKLIR